MARDSASDRLRFFLAEERMDAPSPQPSGASQPPLTMTPVARDREMGEDNVCSRSITSPRVIITAKNPQLFLICTFATRNSFGRNFPHKMEAQKPQSEKLRSVDQAMASCRKKKSEEASFLEDLRDHMDEFINASMDEHKSCFKKTIQKMFGMSKSVAQRTSETKEVESSVPLETTVVQ
ncbi:uncharacterized protein LOC135581845 isoform X3 [Musa acuminata AAA Group]|uniref:uncharacterized protein LOC135581845 isoform X3 n=2 Tax=Musa acuminata AAA Group TaxID=214697 RepID=UPI0031D80050